MLLIWIPLLISMFFHLTRTFFYSWLLLPSSMCKHNFSNRQWQRSTWYRNSQNVWIYCSITCKGYTWVSGLYRVRSDWSLSWKIKIRMLSYIHWLSARKTWCFTALGSTESIDSLDNLIEMLQEFVLDLYCRLRLDTVKDIATLRLLYDITYSVNIRKNL